MNSITLRPSVPQDRTFLYEVYFSQRAPEFAVLPFSEEQKRELVRMQFEAQLSSYSARFPDSRYEIVMLDGQPAGRIWVARQADEFRVVDVVILPHLQNAGIGTTLMQRLQAEAQQARLPIRATVSRTNPGSLRFHLRLGFKVVEEAPFDLYLEWTPMSKAAP
jgi:ribosomal protein S18 acetylase RimI-like enzyme